MRENKEDSFWNTNKYREFGEKRQRNAMFEKLQKVPFSFKIAA